MPFEIPGTLSATGKKVRVRVQTDSLQDAIERVTLRGLIVDPDFLVKTAHDPSRTASDRQQTRPEIGNSEGSRTEPCGAAEIQTRGARKGSSSHVDVASSSEDHSNRKKTRPTSSMKLQSSLTTKFWGIPIAVGAAVIVLIAIFQGATRSKQGSIVGTVPPSETSAPTPPTLPPIEPQISAAEQRQIKIAAATLEACQEMLRIERDIIDRFPTYSSECARAFVKHYPAIPTDQVDSDLVEWFEDVSRAARSILDLEQQKNSQLNQLEKNRDAKALASGLRYGEKAAENGENTADQLGYGLLGAILGGVGSNLETEINKEQTKNQFDQEISEAVHTLKMLHEQQNALTTKLASRYGWTRR